MSSIIVDVQDNVTVTSPYHPEFVRRARQLGGKWSGKAWVFPKIAEGQVREALIDVYGDDGATPTTAYITVTLRFPRREISGQEIWAAGRLICKRPGRDRAVVYGEGVVALTDAFPAKGGSAANPRLEAMDDLVVRVSVPPRVAADLARYAPDAEVVTEEGRGAGADHEETIRAIVSLAETLPADHPIALAIAEAMRKIN